MSASRGTAVDSSMWAPDGDHAGRPHAEPAGRPERPAPDGAPDAEFTSIFGAPGDLLALGGDAVHHRRRGIGTSAGGGDTLDRRQRGASDDVLVTLLAHPAIAAERAVAGAALQASPRLRVDLQRRRSERRDVVFDASLRTVPWRRRSARLRVYGSASMNVTVLTLTPAVARRRPSRWFVRSGTRALERVVAQLADEVEPFRWQPPSGG